MKVFVRKCRVGEIIENQNLDALRREFVADVATFAQPAPTEKLEAYRAIEAAGTIQAFGAFLGDMVVGFITVLTPPVPRCAVPVAVADGLFVAKAYRKTGAGIRLIRAAEAYAAEIGSPCLMIGTPSNGPLAVVLPRIGYAETNRVFTKAVSHV